MRLTLVVFFPCKAILAWTRGSLRDVISLQKHYAKDSPERKKLAAAVAALKKAAPLDIPLMIGGKQVCVRFLTTSLSHMSEDMRD